MKKPLHYIIFSSLILSLILPAIGCQSLPQVSFQASITSGPAPLDVGFTIDMVSSISKSYDKFSWDFGDGATRTTSTAGEAVTHEYTKAGNHTVTLTAARQDDPAKSSIYNLVITVKHGPIARVKINPEKVVLDMGQVQIFTAEFTDAHGNSISDAQLTWETTGEAGTITDDGVLTAGTKAGTFDEGVVATATLDNHSARGKVSVIVLPDVLASVTITPFEVPAGVTLQLEAVAKDQYDNQISDVDISWASLNEAAGTVTESGLFTAGIKAGSFADAVEVNARQNGTACQSRAGAVITPDSLEQVAIAPGSIDIGINEEQQYVAVAADRYGNWISDIDFVWSAAEDAGTITQDGLFTAGDEPGTYNNGVNVEAIWENTTRSVSADITVEQDRIIFMSTMEDEDPEIYYMYIMDIDGNNQEKLFENSVKMGHYSFSPDGRRIIFNINNPDYDMCCVNADGTWLMTVLAGRQAFEPAWSPDGTKIAFQSWEHDPSEIYVMDVDGGNLVQLTDNSAYDDYPHWSPDGTRIVYNTEVGAAIEIYTMNADGSGQKRLTNSYNANWFPKWSPDGTEILFQSNVTGAQFWGIFIMDTNGDNIVALQESTEYSSNAPSWSLDGKKIVFYSWRDDDENPEIYIMDRDGSNVIRLTYSSAGDYFPMFAPRKKGVHVTEDSIVFPGIPPAGDEMTAKEITAKSRDAIVRIKTDLGSGSGFIIESDGLILTNNHVIRDAEEITVYLTDDTSYDGTVVFRDMVHDIALVRIDATNLPALEIGDLSGVELGQQVVVLGYPLGKESISVTSGLVSSIEYDDGSNIVWVQTDSAINPGNSGGPLLDFHGRVIGIVSVKMVGVAVEGVGYAISANTVKLYLPELETQDTTGE